MTVIIAVVVTIVVVVVVFRIISVCMRAPITKDVGRILVMAALYNRQAIIFLPCGFYLLSSSFFFSSSNLSGRRLDVYHTSAPGVALVRI